MRRSISLILLLLVAVLGVVTASHGQVFSSKGPGAGLFRKIPVNTLLLLSGGGTNGSSSFSDSSPFGRSVTASGPVTNSTDQKRYGTGSVLFSGSTALLSVPSAVDLNVGSADFTMEGFLFPTSAGTFRVVATKRPNSNSSSTYLLILFDDNTLRFFASSNGSGWDIASGVSLGAVTQNTWNHFAVCRLGSSWSFLMNGSLTATVTSSAAINSTTDPVVFGNDANGGAQYVGYAHFRFSNKALYTGNYTVPISF